MNGEIIDHQQNSVRRVADSYDFLFSSKLSLCCSPSMSTNCVSVGCSENMSKNSVFFSVKICHKTMCLLQSKHVTKCVFNAVKTHYKTACLLQSKYITKLSHCCNQNMSHNCIFDAAKTCQKTLCSFQSKYVTKLCVCCSKNMSQNVFLMQ